MMPRPSPTLSVSLAVALLTLAGTALAAPPVPTPEAFTAAAARELQAALAAHKTPRLTVTVLGPLTLGVLKDGKKGIEISLDRPWGVCRQEPARCDEARADHVERMASSVIESLKPPAPAERSQLGVIARSADYIEALRARTGEPVAQLVAGDLWAVVMVDGEKVARVLAKKELAGLGLDEEGAFATGLANITRELGGVAKRTRKLSGGEIGALTPVDYYTGGLVLDVAAWAPVARTMKGPLLVSLPADDKVLYADGGAPGARAAFTAVTRKAHAEAAKPVSKAVLRWSSAGWKLAE
jgi:hypothetical protein